MYGGSGNDIISDESGNDRLFGGPGDDAFFGGPGEDYFDCGLGRDEIMDFDQAEGDTRSYNCEN